MSRADLQTYLVELLMKQDRMSMAASIESRVPFLDHELVEHVVALPERFKVRGWTTKAVLRRAARGPRAPRDPPSQEDGLPRPVRRLAARARCGLLLDEFVVSPRALDRGLFEPDCFVSSRASTEQVSPTTVTGSGSSSTSRSGSASSGRRGASRGLPAA